MTERLPSDPAELADRAWEHVAEAFTEGTMTRKDGTKVVLDAKMFVSLVQWVATLKAKKPKLVSADDDFRPSKTKRSTDGTDKQS